MRIKKYYCPKCQEFRNSMQVYDYYKRFNSPLSLKCKICNRSVIEIEPEFKEFLAQKYKD